MLSLIINRNKELKKLYIVFLNSILNRHIKKVQIVRNVLVIKTVVSKIYGLLNFLKSNTLTQFKVLVDLVCYDLPGQKYRFSLVYNLLSIDNNYRAYVKTKVLEKTPFTYSISSLFPGSG
jgi:NADH:ubiquinone oxidoreductase subunit C